MLSMSKVWKISPLKKKSHPSKKISPLSQIGGLSIALKHLGKSLSLPSFLLLRLVVSFASIFFRGEVQQLDLA